MDTELFVSMQPGVISSPYCRTVHYRPSACLRTTRGVMLAFGLSPRGSAELKQAYSALARSVGSSMNFG